MKHTLSRTVLLGVAILLLVEFAGLALYFQIDVNQSVMERTVSGVRELLESNAEILNRTIYEIDDRLNHMIVDEQMYALILSMHDQDVVRRMSWQDDMRRIVFSFLSSSSHHSLSYIYDVNILSSDFDYSDTNYFTYKYDEFWQSELYAQVNAAPRSGCWLRTENAETQLSDRMLRFRAGTDSEVPTQVVRVVKRMNLATVFSKESIIVMPRSVPRPYLILSLSPELFISEMADRQITAHSQSVIITRDGDVVCAENSEIDGRELLAAGIGALFGDEPRCLSGTYTVGGESMLVGAHPSCIDGWYYLYLVPGTDIVSTSRESSMLFLLIVALGTLLTLVLIVFFVRRALRPVALLADTAENIAETRFDANFGASVRETDRILNIMELMNRRIDGLTRDNVELAQREKDASIMMLEMQINPHFLYNSLNKLHISLVNAGQDELAENVLALSRTLRYSVDSRTHVVYLYKDLEQLNQYISAMQSEYDRVFSVYLDVDERLYRSIVPKMLLQPFVENAILHGFRNLTHGGLIRIEGVLNGSVAEYTVCDNGVGLSPEARQALNSSDGRHIGVMNVHRRIQLLFGEEYGVSFPPSASGTEIFIRIPYITERQNP